MNLACLKSKPFGHLENWLLSFISSGLAAAATPPLTYDFAYMCLKNAESLLPASEQVYSDTFDNSTFVTILILRQAAASGVFCEGVGYIGNPVTWAEVISQLSSKYYHLPMKVENLRVAVLAAKAYTALALGDYIPAGSFARDLLARCSLMPIFRSARTSCNTFDCSQMN